MPLLLVFAASDQPLGVVANSEIVAIEIVRTLCGSIGLVAAVPVTTIMAAVLVGTTTTDTPPTAANTSTTTSDGDAPRAAATATDMPIAAPPEGGGEPVEEDMPARPKPSWDDFGPQES